MLRDLFSLFPAYAGVILKRETAIPIPWPFPRIRGGDPRCSVLPPSSVHFSPHTRG